MNEPLIITDPQKHVGKKVHVQGWNFRTVFVLKSFENGVATIETPSTRKQYTTKNRLLYTREDQSKIEDKYERSN